MDGVERIKETVSGWRQLRLSRTDKVSLFVPLIIIVIAEILFFIASSSISEPYYVDVIGIHALNIVFCIVYPMVVKENSSIFQAYSLISLLRILNIGMPSFTIYTLDWVPLIYIPVVLVGVFSLLDEKFDFTMEPGEFPYRDVMRHSVQSFRSALGKWYLVPIGVAIGATLSMAEFYVLRNHAMISDYSLESFVLLFFVMFFCIGLGEELLFRAMLQERTKSKLGAVLAIILASIVFGMMHSGYVNIGYMCYVFFVSLVFGYLYERSHSLMFVTVVHGTINFFLFSIWPYLYYG